MNEQLSLFDDMRNKYYWEYPILSGTQYSLLEIPYPSYSQYNDYFRDYFKQNKGSFDLLYSAEQVWVKPNITGAECWERGKTTNPYVLAALLDYLLEIRKSSDIFVADSSVIGCNTYDAAIVSGIANVCEEREIGFIDLRECTFSKVSVKEALIYYEIEIATPFVSKNIFKINLGKIKSTYGSPVGLTIKNTKGVIKDEVKLQFHTKGVQKAICDLYECVDWNLAVLEGIPISELGKPKCNGSIIISNSALICDYYSAVLLGALPEDNAAQPFHLNLLSCRYGLRPDSFSTEFQKRAQFCEIKLNFSMNGISQLEKDYEICIHDGKPCSGCVESFAKALSSIDNSYYRLSGKFVLGPAGLKIFDNNYVLIGNCAIDNLIMAACNKKDEDLIDDDLFLVIDKLRASFPTRGCPPTIDDIKETIRNAYKFYNKSRSGKIFDGFDVVDIPSISTLMLPKVYNSIIKIIPREKISFSCFDLETIIACETICAAICHQMNWDYLRSAILKKTELNKDWVKPVYLSSIKAEEVYSLFSDYNKPERIRAIERCEILNIIGRQLLSNNRYFSCVFLDDNGLVKNYKDISVFFEKFSTFSNDPEEKKIQILLQSLSEYPYLGKLSGYCKPAIDYHIIRNYIRRGLVFPTTKFAEDYLFNSPDAVRKESTVGTLRGFCSVVIEGLSWFSGLTIRDINTIDWWIGRSVCNRDTPDCLLADQEAQWLKPCFDKCPFYDCCNAIKDKRYLRINEPRYQGSSY